ncbi:hypothetical protein MtrunA17_Chr8g0340621 [Medicago truncatula]|uniref:Uncharacterized protein n=1 Tax=Medicago truncatula TaxID=3880 RepID=A0A396GKF6_MEDTR|nr:hypothetical protein MtrunA17_Chr8g0340621 [Medicago truncatula]
MGSEVVDRSESSSEMESDRRVQGLEGGLELERKAGVEDTDSEREEYGGDYGKEWMVRGRSTTETEI